LTPLQNPREYWNDTSAQYPFRSKAEPEEFWNPKGLQINKQPQPLQSTKFLGYFYPELGDADENNPTALA